MSEYLTLDDRVGLLTVLATILGVYGVALVGMLAKDWLDDRFRPRF
jgi:hypothetical protein